MGKLVSIVFLKTCLCTLISCYSNIKKNGKPAQFKYAVYSLKMVNQSSKINQKLTNN